MTIAQSVMSIATTMKVSYFRRNFVCDFGKQNVDRLAVYDPWA
jgi:hypothetical protein